MSDQAGNDICAVCGVRSTQKCGNCRIIHYCSREHQKSHWKEHSKSCRPVKLAIDSNVGRHYVASRKIGIGEIILKDEKPLVAGPMPYSLPVCLCCYVVLTASSAVPCSKCGWPLCKNCNSHGPECNFTCRYKEEKVSITEFEIAHPTYRSICLIRALSLKESNPEAYRKLLNLEDHCALVTKQANFSFDEPLNIAKFLKWFFKIDDVPEEEIARIAGILQVNGHEVPITEPRHVAVYDTASYIEHSCRANCSKTFTENGGLVIRAAVQIAEGDHISISYTDAVWGTVNRRHHLAKTKFFDCTCERCNDPTEFGTMYNAIACIKSQQEMEAKMCAFNLSDKIFFSSENYYRAIPVTQCTGYMLPRSYIAGPQNYACNKCETTTTWERVQETIENIGIHLMNTKKDDIGVCKDFIKQYRLLLHENHFYNTDVKIALVQMIGDHADGLKAIDDELLAEKILLCKKLDTLLKLLVPAENRIRGSVLFELHAAMAEFGRRREGGELPVILMESRKSLLEAYQLLRHEPECLPEGKIALQARKNIQHMNAILIHYDSAKRM